MAPISYDSTHLAHAHTKCLCAHRSFSSPETALFLVSTKNRDLWPDPTTKSAIHGLPVTLRMLRVKSDKSTNLIGSGLNLLCLQSHSKKECRWTWAEVTILGADQKERGVWGRECSPVNEQVEISLFCTGHLIGWIQKCWNLLFQI